MVTEDNTNRGGRPALAAGEQSVPLTFRVPASLRDRLDQALAGRPRSERLQEWTAAGTTRLEEQADATALRSRYDRTRPPTNPGRIAQTMETVDADLLLTEQLGYLPDSGHLSALEVYGPLKRMMAGIGHLRDRGNVHYRLDWATQPTRVGVEHGEPVWRREGEVTVWSHSGAWTTRPVLATATVALTLHWGQATWSGVGPGTILVASGNRRDATRFTGTICAHLIADLVPSLLVRQQVAEIMDRPEGQDPHQEDVPDWAELASPCAGSEQDADLRALKEAHANLCEQLGEALDDLVSERHTEVTGQVAAQIAARLTGAGWTVETRTEADVHAVWASRPAEGLAAFDAERDRLAGWAWPEQATRNWLATPLSTAQIVCWVPEQKTTTVTLISACPGDQVPGVELAEVDYSARPELQNLIERPEVVAFFAEVGYGPDNPEELMYLLDVDDEIPAGFETLTITL
jgi:hypothetical protein